VITLTRLNDVPLIVNAELIELVESTPDTLVTLTTGRKLNVKESVGTVVDRVIRYRRLVGSPCSSRLR